MERRDIGGVHIKYLHYCQRRLWLYVHGYRPEMSSDLVAFGEQVDGDHYRRARKNIDLGSARIDWLSGTAVVHETKSSRKPSPEHLAQVRFYLALLRERGVQAERGIIHYPAVRRTTTVEWSDDIAAAVDADRDAVITIASSPSPPSRLARTRCNGCAYLDYCWAGDPT